MTYYLELSGVFSDCTLHLLIQNYKITFGARLMPKKKIFYVHWNEQELQQRISSLLAAGYDVGYHWQAATKPTVREFEPDVVVVSLDRLPSHGRRFAEWFWEAKKRQKIPIVFVGGEPEKAAVAKKQFPNASFRTIEETPKVLNRILGQ
jgi:hypothetical protein